MREFKVLAFFLLLLEYSMAISCNSTEVANSDYSVISSITGIANEVVIVTCDPGYTGSGALLCESNGFFNTTITCAGNIIPSVYSPL